MPLLLLLMDTKIVINNITTELLTRVSSPPNRT